MHFVVFRLDAQAYALQLDEVARVIAAVDVRPLPGAPAIVRGAIDIAGEIVPVVDLRRRFQLPERDVGPSDHLVVAQTSRRRVALPVDEAQGVVEYPRSAVIRADQIVPRLEQFQGALQLDDGLVLIHDLDTLLSLDDARELDAVLGHER